MVLLDVSATGEENVIEFQAGNQMNDLEYRRAQLQKMQDAVIDLEDLSSGVSIADLTLNDLRIDLAGHLRDNRDRSEENTSELQSLMRIWYAAFCLTKKKKRHVQTQNIQRTELTT